MLRWLFGSRSTPATPPALPPPASKTVVPVGHDIQLGDKVKDTITGFIGIADCRMHFLNGCVRWNVQPQDLHEGEPIKAHVFDEQQLELLEAKKIVVPVVVAVPAQLAPDLARAVVAARTGGDRKTPQRSSPRVR